MRPLALLVLPVLLALVGAPAAVAQPALVAVPGGTTDEQVRLVVRVPDGARPEGFSASVDGVAQPVTSEPMVSDRMAMGLVVDASADGSPVLPAGLGGAANFVLAAPPSARGALVLDTAPPTVAVPWPSAPAAILGGLAAWIAVGGTTGTVIVGAVLVVASAGIYALSRRSPVNAGNVNELPAAAPEPVRVAA